MASSSSRSPQRLRLLERSRLVAFRRRGVYSSPAVVAPTPPSAADPSGDAQPPTTDPWQRPPSWRVATNLGKSFYFAGKGLAYAVRTQRNFRIHLAVAAVAFALGFGLKLSAVEMALISLATGLVMALELVNTALEAVVDLTLGNKYHLLAAIAKDCAAGAVLIVAAAALLVAAWLFLPPLLLLVQNGLGTVE
ncbi:diacylglycerol kinase [Synechococcus sp. Nb3U1]|uniref:diacylglycerol kinase n=1 Tax=Synechococcus sp. Nb3U1 TaxID=1914529 RepID=UPI002E245095